MKTHSLPSFYNDDSAKYEHSESQSQYGMYWNSFIHRCKQKETKELSSSDVHFHIIIFVLLVIALRLENNSYSKVNEKGKSNKVHFIFLKMCILFSIFFNRKTKKKTHIQRWDDIIVMKKHSL